MRKPSETSALQLLEISLRYSISSGNHVPENPEEITYKPPMKKIAETLVLRFLDICNFHVQYNGNSSIKKSDTRLKIPVATK